MKQCITETDKHLPTKPCSLPPNIPLRLPYRHAEKKLGVKFIVENRKGAGGQIGYTALANAKPDGYTIGTITTMSIMTHELTRKKVPYTLKDSFAPIARVVLAPSGIYVPKDSPFRTLDDLIKFAKKNPKTINVGGTSLWGTHHVHMALLEKEAGIKLNYIPFNGAADVRVAILGKHVDVATGGFAYYAPLIKEGKLRALAVGAPERSPLLDTVPTYKELGYNVIIGSNRGFAAPAGTPQEYIDILSKAFKETLSDPAFLKDAEKIKIVPILAYLDGKAFREYLLKVQADMAKMLKELDN